MKKMDSRLHGNDEKALLRTFYEFINLRGKAVPVVTLRLKFGMSRAEKTMNTCMIIVDTKVDGEDVAVGALADSVQDVLTLQINEIEPPPHMGTTVQTDFIRGIGKHGDKFIYSAGCRQDIFRK